MAYDYTDLQATATALIEEFGGACTITHLDGNQSRGTIVIPTHSASDVSIPDVGTVSGTETVAFINNVRNQVCVGDTVVGYGTTWRVRESAQYKGPEIGLAYRVVLDA